MFKTLLTAGAFAASATVAFAQDDTMDEMASEEEMQQISEAIGAFNCELPEEVEKESENLFELDDAVCDAGQYDIKLDENMVVTSMTYDGPADE